METSLAAVSVVGLGKLGAPLAACLASRGFTVVGVDRVQSQVDSLRTGRTPVVEQGLQELITANSDRIRATTDVAEAVRATSVTFIVVATPSGSEGAFSLEYVLPVAEAVGKAIRDKDGYHLVVLTSTVTPGATGGAVREALETASGKRCGDGFGLCYNPEFLALGTAIHDMLNPDFVLIGESDVRAGDALEALFHDFAPPGTPVARMGFVNAELTKLAVNTFLTTKISYANMLARVCEHLPESNVDVVTKALGLDRRIGPSYLRGAVSYGGPCFPRDNLAFAALARSVGSSAALAEVTDAFNRMQIMLLADQVVEHLTDAGTVGILGLSYKPGTDVVEESTGLLLARELAKRQVKVVGYDPAGAVNARAALGDALSMLDSAEACIHASEVVAVTTAWPEFKAIPVASWNGAARPRTVIDCWRALDHLETAPGVRYLPTGRMA